MGAAATSGKVTAGEMVARARALVPRLRERAPEANRQRRLPDETVRDFHEAGLYRILQPSRFGGYELDYGIQIAVAAELGRGCGSSAWVLSVTACHSWILGMYPEQAQLDIWGERPETLIGSAFVPEKAKLEQVEGGYRLSGHWKFASGIHACDWIILGAVTPVEGGAPVFTWCMVPKGDFRVEDAWFVSGLRATGSEDIRIDDPGVFVPAHRTMNLMDFAGGPTPGSEINPGHIFRLPLWALFPYNVCAATFGIAAGALENYVARTRDQMARSTGVKVADMPTIQLRVAESAAEIDCARVLLDRDIEEFNRLVRAGEDIPMDKRLVYRRNVAYAALLNKRALDRIMAVTGAHGLFDDNPMQLAARDMQAALAQIALAWDVHGVAYGRSAFGLDPLDPWL